MYSNFLLALCFSILQVKPQEINEVGQEAMAKTSYWNYPRARRQEQYYERLHGKRIYDPYHWLEDHKSQETIKFWNDNNKVLEEYLNKNKQRKLIEQSITKLMSAPTPGKPSKKGDYYYYTERASLQGNAVFYRKKNLNDQPEAVLDPNPLSPDSTANIKFTSFSNDNKYFIIGVSRKGSDWVELRIFENKEKLVESERLIWTQDSSVTWSTDNKGFFYSKDPKPSNISWDEGGLNTDPGIDNKLYYHKVGTKQEQDILIWEDVKHPVYYAGISYAGKNNEYFILQVYRSTAQLTYTYYADAKESNVNGVTKPPTFIKIYEDFDGFLDYIESVDEKNHLFYSSRNAIYRKVVVGPLEDKNKLKDYLPEVKGYGLTKVVLGKNKIAASYIKDSRYSIRIYSKNNTSQVLNDIKLPIGGLKTFKFDKDETVLNYNVTDFFYPVKSFDVNLNSSSEHKLVYQEDSLPGFQPSNFVQEQTFYESEGGIKIPITLAYPKGIKRDGKNPVYLYGYGGFNNINTPAPRAHWLAMLQNLNMVLAIAHIRGGGESGFPWYDAGRVNNKQNSFTDFQYAARYLVHQGYTCHSKIVINGRSNGGMLTGVSYTQAPTLFGAVVTDVGVHDLVRYQRFNDGTGWIDDFGDVLNEPKALDRVLKYSPYHNIYPNKPYPPVLITTGSHDDRVSTLHSLKFAAKLQYYYRFKRNPVLLQVANNTGHGCTGCGKPVGLDIVDKTNMLTFISSVFNLKVKA